MTPHFFKTAAAILVLGVWAAGAAAAEFPEHPLIEMAREKRGLRVREAVENGAKTYLTDDEKSFYVVWLPEGSDPQNPPPMVVSIHGHGGYAFEDFHVWYPFLKKRGYGLLAIQWWLGGSEATEDYLKPQEIYRVFDKALHDLHVRPGRALLHGFSRGSANIYPVAAFDRVSGNHYFSLFIANAGRANSDYPPVHEIEEGKFGARPLEGTHWVTYAGGRDPNPDRSGIPGMRETGEWIRRYGGTVDLAIEDPQGDHGGFHIRSQNAEAALDQFRPAA